MKYMELSVTHRGAHCDRGTHKGTHCDGGTARNIDCDVARSWFSFLDPCVAASFNMSNFIAASLAGLSDYPMKIKPFLVFLVFVPADNNAMPADAFVYAC